MKNQTRKLFGDSGKFHTLFICISTLIIASCFTLPASGAGLLIADGGFGGKLEIEEQDVSVAINNGVAVTTVTQVFRNKENRQVEALYTFPVPKKASVSNFSMWINGKEMIGEVLEKERARKIYNSYKKTKRDPGLLEQKNYKTFEMRIFPIAAKAAQKIQISYYQELDVDHDWATYVFPLATETKQTGNQRTTGRFSINLNVLSEIPITKMESPSHSNAFAIVKHTDNYYQASLETKQGDLNKDVVLAYHLQRAKTGFDIIYSKTEKEDGYFLMTVTAGPELEKLNKGMDFIFVLDVSGSMANGGKMSMSRTSLDAFINALSPEDRLEMMTFNVKADVLFKKMEIVSESSRNRASEFLRNQQARGGTDLRPAINTAYKYANPDRQLNVIILSDGMTEQGTRRELLDIINSRPGNVRVFCVGVGNEVNRPLLRQIAQDAGGLASFISRGDDFERQAKGFRRKLMRPAVSNLKIDFSDKVYDIEPKQLPNLYHGMPIRIFGRYKGAGKVNVKLSGEILGKAFDKTLQIDMPAVDNNNPEIERMWAWHKMQRLLDDGDRNGSRDNVIDEIVRLGEGYSIVSEYTSFLVLENDQEYKRWKIERKNVLRTGRDRVSQEKLRETLKQMRNSSTANIGPLEQAVAKPKEEIANNSVNQSQQAPQTTRKSSNRRGNRSFDIGFPSGGGGGAIDPLSALIALSMLGLSYCGFRKRK